MQINFTLLYKRNALLLWSVWFSLPLLMRDCSVPTLSSSSHPDLPQLPNTALFLGHFFAPLPYSFPENHCSEFNPLLSQHKMLHSPRDQQKLPFLLPSHLERKSAFWGLELSAQCFLILQIMRCIIFNYLV